ncbi:MAG: hypothetical protein ACI4UX_05615 [Clostridia bacterium]
MEELIKKIIGSVPKDLTELETAYFVYLELGKVLVQNTEYAFTSSLSKQTRLFNDGKNINSIDFPNVICNSSSKLYVYILNKLGINADCFYYKNAEHADTIIRAKDGSIYYSNLIGDLSKIQTGRRTRHFAPPSEYINSIFLYELEQTYHQRISSLPIESIEAMDNKFGYTIHGLYMNDFISRIKKEMKNPNFINEYVLPKNISIDTCTPSELLKYKFLFLINNLNIYSEQNDSAGFLELKNYYDALCSAIFSEEEDEKVNIYSCYYNSLKNKDLSSYIALELSENDILYFVFSNEENKYISISKEEVQKCINNGLTPYKSKSIKGIEKEH